MKSDRGSLSRASISLGLALLATTLFGSLGITAASAAQGTVTISGNAYAFFGIDNTMPGAVVKIEEYPKLEAAVQPNGRYEIEVPDGVNVTPYIIPAEEYDPGISLTPPPPYERVYNQTFRTSGEDLKHVHFQIPANQIYKVFIRMLGAEFTGPVGDERIKNCAIVSTFSMKEARAATEFRPPTPRPQGYPQTFRDVYPHGVPNSAGTISPRPLTVDGPVFFAFRPTIAPDRSLGASTEDGGVLWTEVPPGYYWLQASNPDPAVRFAPFMAKCTPGRLVNASPPWGFYELEEGAEPNPAVYAKIPDTVVSARVGTRASVSERAGKRTVSIPLDAEEPLDTRLEIFRGKARIGSLVRKVGEGRTVLRKAIKSPKRSFRAKLRLALADRAGNEMKVSRTVLIRGR